ncbi:MAG: hypothetical protein ACREQV_07100 [Candidatus Binatia bacterium]
MDNGKFILCRKCDTVHHVTPLDKTPAHGLDEAKEIPTDDWRGFMDQHAGHGLEALKALGEQYFPQGLSSDPMAVAYLKVTNGQREYLLRRSRRSIAEPLRFERIDGNLGAPAVALDIQEREIRKELTLRFRGNDGEPFSEAKIDLFIALFRAIATQMDARNMIIDAEPSYTDDNIVYAALDAPAKDSLLKQCAGHFTPDEMQALRRFVESHGDGSDVMTLVLRRRMVIAEPVN